MDTRQAYNQWAEQYDTNENKTRDLEAAALREMLGSVSFDSCIEIGCGTGKNTVWLKDRARYLLGVDLSEEMLAQAKKRVIEKHVDFYQADITKDWDFVSRKFDLVSFSLMLEHIEDLEAVFQKAAAVLNAGGCLYLGELHPFKQYSGSKARFETDEGVQVVSCFTHHVSEFTAAAKNAGLEVESIKEYFDEEDRNSMPRILAIVFRKR